MNRTTRNAMAAAMAAAVAFGVTAPAASAAPRLMHAKAHHHVAKAHKGAKADRTLTAAQRRLSREAARKDAYLGRLAKSHKLTRLPDDVESAVAESIKGDRSDLDALKTDVASKTGADLRTVSGDLREIRPEVYNTIINQLRLATRMQTAAAALPQFTALTDLIATLEGYDATATRAELRAAQRELNKVQAAVEQADQTDTPDTPETPGAPTGGTTTP